MPCSRVPACRRRRSRIAPAAERRSWAACRRRRRGSWPLPRPGRRRWSSAPWPSSAERSSPSPMCARRWPCGWSRRRPPTPSVRLPRGSSIAGSCSTRCRDSRRPNPRAAAIDSQVAAIEARAGSPAALDATLGRGGFTRGRLAAWVRDDLRIAAYLDQRFATSGAPGRGRRRGVRRGPRRGAGGGQRRRSRPAGAGAPGGRPSPRAHRRLAGRAAPPHPGGGDQGLGTGTRGSGLGTGLGVTLSHRSARGDARAVIEELRRRDERRRDPEPRARSPSPALRSRAVAEGRGDDHLRQVEQPVAHRRGHDAVPGQVEQRPSRRRGCRWPPRRPSPAGSGRRRMRRW